MKKIVFLLSFLVSTGIYAQESHSIKIKLAGIEDGKTAYLAHYFGYNQYVKQDSTKAINSTYHFEAKSKLPQGMYLLVLSPSKYYQLLVTDEQNFSIETDTLDFGGNAKVVGSKENKLFFDFQRGMKDRVAEAEAEAIAKAIKIQNDVAIKTINEAKLNKIQAEIDVYRKAFIKNNSNAFVSKVIKATLEPEVSNEPIKKADGSTDSTAMFYRYRNHFLDNIDFSDDRMLRTPFLHQKVERYFKELTVQTADSIIKNADHVIKLSKANKDVFRYCLWYVTNKYETPDIVGLDAVFIHLAENYYINGQAFWADSTMKAKFQERITILKPLMLEKPFPELNLTNNNDQWQKLADVKAKYTIVNFYDTDCGHCKEAAPKLAAYAKTHDKNKVVIYNVTINPDTKKWLSFIETYKTQDLINVRDVNIGYNYKQRYDVFATPTIYILDEKKNIIGRKIPIEEFDKYIDFWERRKAEKKQ